MENEDKKEDCECGKCFDCLAQKVKEVQEKPQVFQKVKDAVTMGVRG